MLSATPESRADSHDGAAVPRVLFVCKGSAKDGLGHVMRTQTVARAMDRRADAQIIAIGGVAVKGLLEESGLACTVVPTTGDAAALSAEFAPDVVVFDLLSLSPGEFEAIAGHARTVSLSPIFDRMASVEVVFHRTAMADPTWESLSTHPQFRMGLQYAVVDPDCHRIPSRTFQETLARKRLSVAISMGGADAANKTLQVINTLRTSGSRLLLWVLLGEGYTHSYQDLVDSARGARHEIILAKTNESMWHILATCGLAILAGGTTTYQAAYAGLPSLNILEAPGRQFLIQELLENGVCLSAGDDVERSLTRLNGLVEDLDAHRDVLHRMHRRASTLIDGNGARRIATEILALASPETSTR